jgi:hypothetical protein
MVVYEVRESEGVPVSVFELYCVVLEGTSSCL